ncbi:hypothetical protein, partial [Microbacterium dextranolyticum]|uniref:hypothetical protein n=1 Tax=Microbacterium dextranolyticum TaxID=36806 RepID=UPI003CD09A1D
PRGARVDPLGRAHPVRASHHPPSVRGGDVHRVALGLLLHRPLPLESVRPPRA